MITSAIFSHFRFSTRLDKSDWEARPGLKKGYFKDGMYPLLALIALTPTLTADDWVSRHGVHFKSETNVDTSVKKMLATELKNVQIVGLGEASHGISEFFKIKSSLIKHLVSDEDFSLIMIEASFGEGVLLNEFISGERADLEDVLRGMPLWYFKVEEFRDLLLWLRDFNKSHSNRIRIYGMEMQYVDRSLLQIKKFLDKVDPDSSEIWARFGANRIGTATAGAAEFFYLWQPFSSDILRQHSELLLELRKRFSTNKIQYLAKSTDAEFGVAYRHVIVLEQFISASMQSEEPIKHQMRDYFMYLNLQWTRAHLNNPKTIVWAHNEHLWKQPGNGGYDVLGRQLDRVYGKSYFALGFDFGEGTYRAPSNAGWEHLIPKPGPTSLSYRMSELGKPNFLLNIRAAIRADEKIPDSVTLRASSGGYTPMRDGRIQYDREYSLRDRYDAIVFVNKVAPPKVLK